MKAKNITIILFSVIILLVGSFFVGSKLNKNVNNEVKMITIDLEEMIIKLSDSKYLKTNITLEYNEKNKELESKVSIIRDSIITNLMSKKEKDFEGNNVENTKEDIKFKLNQKLNEEVINNVYFTNLVVQ